MGLTICNRCGRTLDTFDQRFLTRIGVACEDCRLHVDDGRAPARGDPQRIVRELAGHWLEVRVPYRDYATREKLQKAGYRWFPPDRTWRRRFLDGERLVDEAAWLADLGLPLESQLARRAQSSRETSQAWRGV